MRVESIQTLAKTREVYADRISVQCRLGGSGVRPEDAGRRGFRGSGPTAVSTLVQIGAPQAIGLTSDRRCPSMSCRSCAAGGAVQAAHCLLK